MTIKRYFCGMDYNDGDYCMSKRRLMAWTMVLVGVCMGCVSCNNGKTYAEYKREERAAIQDYIEQNGIQVITMEQFLAQDTMTDVSKNEFVLFSDKGVYMQIEEKGGGELMDDGRHEMLARFWEFQIKDGGLLDTLCTNTIANIYPHPDEFVVTKSGSNFSATFSSGCMYDTYGSSVPSGWMLPFQYIKVGREISARSRIKLIVPHSEGTTTASSYIYPALYTMTLKLAR